MSQCSYELKLTMSSANAHDEIMLIFRSHGAHLLLFAVAALLLLSLFLFVFLLVLIMTVLVVVCNYAVALSPGGLSVGDRSCCHKTENSCTTVATATTGPELVSGTTHCVDMADFSALDVCVTVRPPYDSHVYCISLETSEKFPTFVSVPICLIWRINPLKKTPACVPCIVTVMGTFGK